MGREFSIMNDYPPYWRNFRFSDRCHRHEVFGGFNRQKSIEDGLVIFLTPEQHNMSNQGIHFNLDYDRMAKKKAQELWMSRYHGSIDDFIRRYGKNYL